MPALDAHQRGYAAGFMNAADVVGGEGHFERFGMSAGLFVYAVDHVHRASRRSAVARVTGRDVNGEEFSAQSAFFHSRDVGLNLAARVARAEIEAFVSHRRSDVVVCVYDNRIAVQFYRALAELRVVSGGRLGLREGHRTRDKSASEHDGERKTPFRHIRSFSNFLAPRPLVSDCE